ncbi:tyrosine-type recombinase/integrase [Escherichia coli]|nr:tyrosine-type recombinase/integrase [Escherichia coli]EEQ4335270.1 tyrosine-type recombinase/integrase [Escherichia coli]EEQ9544284.1 tyrosine-type recombinase/integrase [Escherichia coli]EEQ9574908.1 tyrosine-type recombinase/integrase [Escherichia coli]EER2012189.1 tyrosine-type recombinase/integrase [Escherichia coli]
MTRRRFLTAREVTGMMEAVRNGNNGARDYCLILMAFRHGMRISELLGLRYRDMDLEAGRMSVNRLKNGFSTVHPLIDDELDAIRTWTRVRSTWRHAASTDTVFISRKGTMLSRQQAYRIIRAAGELAGAVTCTTPHMLRHACGYELAERGTDTRLIQDYLGHRNIRHTVRYTASNAARFNGLWEREKICGDDSGKQVKTGQLGPICAHLNCNTLCKAIPPISIFLKIISTI